MEKPKRLNHYSIEDVIEICNITIMKECTSLNGVEYCVSRQFDATRKPDLLQIVFILRKLKALILARL